MNDDSYHSEEGLDDKKDKVQGDHHEDGEFSLHEAADQSKLEEEGLPDEEEEPEDEAEVHNNLNS